MQYPGIDLYQTNNQMLVLILFILSSTQKLENPNQFPNKIIKKNQELSLIKLHIYLHGIIVSRDLILKF